MRPHQRPFEHLRAWMLGIGNEHAVGEVFNRSKFVGLQRANKMLIQSDGAAYIPRILEQFPRSHNRGQRIAGNADERRSMFCVCVGWPHGETPWLAIITTAQGFKGLGTTTIRAYNGAWRLGRKKLTNPPEYKKGTERKRA